MFERDVFYKCKNCNRVYKWATPWHSWASFFLSIKGKPNIFSRVAYYTGRIFPRVEKKETCLECKETVKVFLDSGIKL